MSQSDSDVDLDSPDYPDDAVHQDSMEYLRSFQFISENPNWMQNVLFVGICQLIPIAGPIATMGYQFEVAESLVKRSSPNGYADFDFSRFPDYLMRGLWPFLVALVVGLVLVIPIMLLWMAVFFMFMIGSRAAAPGGPGPGPQADAAAAGVLVAMGIGFLILMVLSFGIHLVMVPMSLRAGFSQDFGEAFKFGFVRDFVGKMWVEMIFSMLFLTVCSIPLMLIGVLLCGVGMYFTIAIMMIGQAHLLDYQLYEVYLSRGGEPIPFKTA